MQLNEEYTPVPEARLPIPVIITETPCPGCGILLTNRSCYYNKCQECSRPLSLKEKNPATSYIANIPYTRIKDMFNSLPLPLTPLH